MTSRRPYWCPKTINRRPCWCPEPILWELSSFLSQTLSFVPINLHRCWPREWKHFIECFYSHYKQLSKCIGTKERFYIGKKGQLPQDWSGTQTWPPFYCFETPIWPPWRHVKTLSAFTWPASMQIYWNKINFYIRKRFNSHRIRRSKAISELLQASASKRG